MRSLAFAYVILNSKSRKDSLLYLIHIYLVFEGEGAIIMGDVASVGLYTLNGCTYAMIKQTNNSNGGGELHLGMETFRSLMHSGA